MRLSHHPLAVSSLRIPFVVALMTTALLFPQPGRAEETSGTKIEFFEKKIRPILSGHCYQCHSADTKPAGGLRVDDRHGLLMGGDAGPAVVAGDPGRSLLLERIRSTDPKKHMPKEGDPLTEEQVADLTAWIADGAAWPSERIPANLGRLNGAMEELKANHWAWQPLTNPPIPAVSDTAWPKGDLDRFVLAKLEAAKLPPVTGADALTLIRRITFDLTGLPPTPEEVDDFINDTSESALAKVVDRLLASPAFGERWGRRWLDIARYGESTGPSRNIPYPHAWRYRDYVIQAVQNDVPYDRFILEQIAGDLLPAASAGERDRLLTATGFLALGVKDVNQRFKTRFIMDNVDEQIDAVTRSVLALTVSCARCHDHKFDPIPVTDYYALAGIFTSTDDCAGVRNKMGGGGLDYYDPKMLLPLTTDLPPVPAEQVAKLEAETAAAKKAFEEIRGTPQGLKPAADGRPTQRGYRMKWESLQAKLLSLTDPGARGHAVHGAREGKVIADTEIRLRGEAERLGPTVPRGFLTTFPVPGAPAITPDQSGRLELAQWLTSPQNPLTPRVIVNRVWASLFGTGIVNTVDNFGVKGDTPSHPELLDHLAHQFMSDGWSIKRLIRTMVLSRAYQLGSEAPTMHRASDPANRLVWRHAPRRLTTEELRDTVLASSGALQSKAAASPVQELRMIEMRDNGTEARTINESADRSTLRSIYLPLLRGVTPKALDAFDPVSQTLVTGQRDATTVPTQALFLLNSGFIRQQSLALAERLLQEGSLSEEGRIQELYRRTLSRDASGAELARAREFITLYEASYQEPPIATPVLAAADTRTTETTDAKEAPTAPANPDDVDRSDALPQETLVVPPNARAAAWMSLAQALYASAEFRFVR